MPIILKIDEPPFDVDIVELVDGQISATILIGSDEDRGINYFSEAVLSPYDEDCPEYSFAIIAHDVVENTYTTFMSGLKTAELFSRDDRETILSAICWATQELLNFAQPQKVYRCTHDVRPPDKAVEKHHMISVVFAACGYKVARCNDWHGQRVWIAERV